LRGEGHSLSITALFLIFALALGFRLGYLLLVVNGPLENSDSPTYETLALRLSQHESYANAMQAGFSDDLLRPPGYPLFLVLINRAHSINRIRTATLQSILSACFAVVLAILVGRLTCGLSGIVAGVLYATDWATTIYAPLIVAETLLVILLGAALCIYALSLRRSSAVLSLAAGLLLGLSVLVKPIAQMMLIPFLLAWLLQKKRHVAGLAFLMGYAICVIPWVGRNYERYGVATISPIGTVNLYLYTAEASAHPHSFADVSGSAMNDDLIRINSALAARARSASELQHEMEHESVGLILHNSHMVLKQSTVGLARTCFGTGFVTVASSLPHPPGHAARALFALLPFLQLIPLWTLAFVGATRKGTKLLIRAMLVVSVIFLVLPASSSVGQSRFRVPAVPALAMLAGIGASPSEDGAELNSAPSPINKMVR
jgi:4-amino-4-deoxy-L-arabinose transferase-like glycosyltransferase